MLRLILAVRPNLAQNLTLALHEDLTKDEFRMFLECRYYDRVAALYSYWLDPEGFLEYFKEATRMVRAEEMLEDRRENL